MKRYPRPTGITNLSLILQSSSPKKQEKQLLEIYINQIPIQYGEFYPFDPEPLNIKQLMVLLHCNELTLQKKLERYISNKFKRQPEAQKRALMVFQDKTRAVLESGFKNLWEMALRMRTMALCLEENATDSGWQVGRTINALNGQKNAFEAMMKTVEYASKHAFGTGQSAHPTISISNIQNQAQIDNQFLTPTQAQKLLESQGTTTALNQTTHQLLYLKNGIEATEECRALVSDGQGFNRAKALEAMEAKILAGKRKTHETRREAEYGIQDGDVE